MNLDEAQKQTVARWLEEGLKVSEVQNRIASEFGLRLTYMEVRFLLDDLKLKPKDPEPAAPAPASPLAQGKPAGPSPPPATAVQPEPEQEDAQNSRVSVTVDQVTRPGAMVSGRVQFSDGNKAEWYLDQYGRLGLIPSTPTYRPSQEDVTAFQNALQDELARMGM